MLKTVGKIVWQFLVSWFLLAIYMAIATAALCGIVTLVSIVTIDIAGWFLFWSQPYFILLGFLLAFVRVYRARKGKSNLRFDYGSGVIIACLYMTGMWVQCYSPWGVNCVWY